MKFFAGVIKKSNATIKHIMLYITYYVVNWYILTSLPSSPPGIVAQSPRKEDQISMTHPKMFPYFGFDREWLFHNQRKRGGPGVMRQVCLN